jgi:chemotaxis signal transduction protein
MSGVNAWLLDLGDGLHAAVGELELVHVLPDPPTLFEIPQSPAYCRKVLVWEGEMLPLMNLAMRLSVLAVPKSQVLVAITAFQEHPGAALRHGALLLGAPPVQIRVNDSLACELPEAQPDWQRLAIACFRRSDLGPVPVLDLEKVFSLPTGDIDE